MPTTDERAIAALLGEAEEAHREYQEKALGGEFDLEWPRWVARYTLDHGISALLHRTLTPEELIDALRRSTREFEALGSPRTWAEFTADKLAIAAGPRTP